MTDCKQLSLDLASPLGHHESLHSEPHGTVIYWQRRAARGNRWHKVHPGDPIPQLVAPHAGGTDRYVTVNEFCQWRMVRLLRSLRACYVDVDGCTDLPTALDALHSAGMPEPTAVVYSGHGMHLYWMLEPVPPKALPVWQRVQNALIEALRPVGADPVARDCARVLRLAGSIHGGTGQEVQGRILGGRWTLATLANEVLGERTPGRKRKRGNVRDLRPRQMKVGGGIFARWHLVYTDLQTIAEYYWFGGIPDGYRDTWLFLSSVALSWFAHPATISREIEAQARSWTPGLTAHKVRTQMRPVVSRATRAAAGETIQWCGEAVDPRYRFRRQTLYEWIHPLITDDLQPRLRAIIPNELAQERERERVPAKNRQRRQPRAEYLKERRQKHQKARQLRDHGYSWREVGEALGISAQAARNAARRA